MILMRNEALMREVGLLTPGDPSDSEVHVLNHQQSLHGKGVQARLAGDKTSWI